MSIGPSTGTTIATGGAAAITGCGTKGKVGGSGGVMLGGVGGSGAGREGGEMPLPDSDVLTGEIGDEDWQIVPRFQFQIHPWIPVSIVLVISLLLVSPHPDTVRFHTHDEGAAVTGCAGEAAVAGLASGCGAAGAGSGWGAGAVGVDDAGYCVAGG